VIVDSFPTNRSPREDGCVLGKDEGRTTMRKSRRLPWVALLSLAIAVGAILASMPLAAGSGSKPAARAPRALSCTPTNPQPAQPLEMNTVVVAGVAKTVAMEKELFDCQDPATGEAFSRDVETFVELVEQDVGTDLRTRARRVMVATCDKNFTPTGSVSCRASNISLGAPVPNPLLGCRPLPPTGAVKTPADPVEMNSVALGEFIKTIKLEKEVLGCDNAIGDVYLFTEVIEKRTTAPSYTSFANRFEGIMCLKNPALGVIQSCTRFTTT
jgi:hypothetical protein